jgi:sterol carrier protein
VTSEIRPVREHEAAAYVEPLSTGFLDRPDVERVATETLTFDVAALGATYLGGSRLRDAVLAHGVDDHRNGALADADALLRTADEPWCSTFL